MVSQKKEKLFRLTPDDETRVNALIQYAYKSGFIPKPSLQEFMEFAIQCADSLLEKHHSQSQGTQGAHRRRPII